MRLAIDEAGSHLHLIEGGPFGACLVNGEKVLAVAHNTVLKDNDPTCHAEINAIRLAARHLRTYDLSGSDLYSTTEPCPMCFAAAHWARLTRIIYGTTVMELAQLGFNELLLENRRLKTQGHSLVELYPNFLLEECRRLLKKWEQLPGRQTY
jgi:tRNA(Arg) A34 adenosine deaminase TadA